MFCTKIHSQPRRPRGELFILVLFVLLSTNLAAQDLIWVKRTTATSGGDRGNGVAVDDLGNSYVTGSFHASATFGAGESNETILTGAGHEIFIAKYDANGALLWAQSAGGSGADFSYALVIDVAGNSYVTGEFHGSAIFGSGESNETVLTGIVNEIFVAKYGASGALIWAKRAGGSGFDAGYGIAIDEGGNSIVTGRFEGLATFGSDEANETILSGDLNEIFVAKYDASGALMWAKQVGGSGSGQGFGVAVDGSDNSYVTGVYAGQAIFGPGEANETIFTGINGQFFVAKYSGNGVLIWAKSAGGSSGGNGKSIAVDDIGNSYVTGGFSNTAIFGVGEANETTLTGSSLEVFAAKYDVNGALVWAKSVGGISDDLGYGIAIDANGNSYVAGTFEGSATFGAGEANEVTLVGVNLEIFAAKFDKNGALLWARRAGGAGEDEPSAIAVDKIGQSYVTGFFQAPAVFGPGEPNETTLNEPGKDMFLAKLEGKIVKPVAFLANKVTLKSTKQSTSAGDIHSNGVLTVEKGDPSVYNSNLSAVGKIIIEKDNTINGNVISPLAISNAGTINGTTTVGPVANIPLPSKSYSAGGLNRTVPNGGSLTLAPGSYGIVTLNGGGTLKLTSGDYFFNELRYPGSEAVIEFNLSSGNAANVNIVSNFQFGKEAAIRLLPNGESDSELVTFFTLQSTAVSIGKEAYFLGTLNAPNALVTLVKNSQLRGSICANEILVEKDCLFLHHDSPGSLPGPGNLPKPSSEDDGQQETSNQQTVTSYALEQNYPNPFNPSTAISFQLPVEGEVSLVIYNMSGQIVKRLVASEMHSGRHSIVWDATDAHGARVASGVYVYMLKAGNFTAQRKLVLIK